MTIRYVRGSAGEFHHRPVAPTEASSNELWVHEISGPALVLGSSQRQSLVDVDAADRAGVEIVRRRSGGGAVWLSPGDVTWMDIVIRPGGPGWGTDVHTPMNLLGAALAAALDDDNMLGGHRIDVHRGPMDVTEWSGLVCFDGMGPGEVTLDGRKLIGISQRRTRDWARLQCCWYHRYDAADVLRWFVPGPHVPRPDELRPAATVPPQLSSVLIDAAAAAFDVR